MRLSPQVKGAVTLPTFVVSPAQHSDALKTTFGARTISNNNWTSTLHAMSKVGEKKKKNVELQIEKLNRKFAVTTSTTTRSDVN